jgi:hypothetical protein
VQDEETRQLMAHVQHVLSTSHGKDMFAILKRQYVDVGLWRKDQREQDALMGKHDLITYLISLGEYDV